MDDCCDTDSPLGVRDGEQLHNGWVHPYFDCDRNCCGVDQDHPGTKNLVVRGGPET